MRSVTGYTERHSYAAGDVVELKVSCDGVEEFDCAVVRLSGPAVGSGPHVPPFRPERLPTPIDGTHPGTSQPIRRGSWLEVPESATRTPPGSFTLALFAYPTLITRSDQVLIELAHEGVAILLDGEGRLCARLGADALRLDVRVPTHRWCLVALSYDASAARAHLLQEPVGVRATLEPRARGSRGGRVAALDARLDAPVWIAGRPDGAHFNGRIAQPALHAAAVPADRLRALAADPRRPPRDAAAAWDLSIDMGSDRAVDVSGGERHGILHGHPTRAVTGPGWRGDAFDWRMAGDRYDAVHFHEDDGCDAGWATSMRLTIPEDWTSGVYAAWLRARTDAEAQPALDDVAEWWLPFAVRPARAARADVALLLPTLTYAAYANESSWYLRAGHEAAYGIAHRKDATDLLQLTKPEIGRSSYNDHVDGSPIVLSSMRRPVVNFRPTGARVYKLMQDLFTVAWLDRSGVAFDVTTDEDVDREGPAALDGYRVLVTGSHPEYASVRELDVVEGFVREGGRLMYLGGNGFCWAPELHPTDPGIMQLRRNGDPSRDEAERHSSWSGQRCGRTGTQGRPESRLLGVEMISEGWGRCAGYRRTDASRSSRAAFVFEGVDAEVFGDRGFLGGGAAGFEIDRTTPWTPRHALILAASFGHTGNYDLGLEREAMFIELRERPERDPVRAEMVFFETEGGGAVFSVGSIAWNGSLSYDGYDNDVARITANVLRRFRDPAPFKPPPDTRGGSDHADSHS